MNWVDASGNRIEVAAVAAIAVARFIGFPPVGPQALAKANPDGAFISSVAETLVLSASQLVDGRAYCHESKGVFVHWTSRKPESTGRGTTLRPLSGSHSESAEGANVRIWNVALSRSHPEAMALRRVKAA
jgi:hypothetical protein